MEKHNPILSPPPKDHINGDFSADELSLANRNSGTLLESLRHDVTPLGAHYLLNHFDIPFVADARQWSLAISGCLDTPLTLSMQEIRTLPVITRLVTLECAGNGRRNVSPRWPSQPWGVEAVGTSEWTGTTLKNVLDMVSIHENCTELVFHGADNGVDGGNVHHFARSLSVENAMHNEVMLAWQMNGADLAPQHGFPLRLIVPGWYGMASVKWLSGIEAITGTFQGYQQSKGYVYRQTADDPGVPVTHMRVKSLLVPPGIPDWATRKRLMHPELTRIHGRAWSGSGVPIARVEVGIDGQWFDATITPSVEPDTDTAGHYAWCGWHFDWPATLGKHEISSRATDANGEIQPLVPPWDIAGFGNNSVQKVEVWCDDF